MGFLGKLVIGFVGFFVILYVILKLGDLPKYQKDKERAKRVADRLIPYVKNTLPKDFVLSYIEINYRLSVAFCGYSGGTFKVISVGTSNDLGFDTSKLPTYMYGYPKELARQIIERYPLPGFEYKSSKIYVSTKSTTEFVVRGPQDSTSTNPIRGYQVVPVTTIGEEWRHYVLPCGMNPKDLGKIGAPVRKKEDIL